MDVMRNHIKIALVETIARIFKYSLPQIKFLKIEGVIAVTADTDVFIVHVDQDYDLNREKNDNADVSCVVPNRELSVKTEPPSSPHENGSDCINNDPSIQALLEHFQTIKKENHSNETNHSIEENSEIRTGSSHSESFCRDGSWNMEESADDDSTLNQQEENFLKAHVLKNRPPCKRLVKKRRSSLMSHHSNPSSAPPLPDPLRASSGIHGNDNDFIITESFHICAYQNCFKRFKLRRDLLRHQTKKHGRVPVRRRKKNIDSMIDGEEEPMYLRGHAHSELLPDDGRADLIEGPV